MIVLEAVLAWLAAWWAIAPLACMIMGWRAGHPWLGWACGCIPLAGPWVLAAMLRSLEGGGGHEHGNPGRV